MSDHLCPGVGSEPISFTAQNPPRGRCGECRRVVGVTQAGLVGRHQERQLKPPSDLEATLLGQLRLARLPAPDREWQFDEGRRWRFDLAWPHCRLAVEVQGGTWSGGRHTRGLGLEGEYAKLNAAVLAGWRVLLFGGNAVGEGVALGQIEQALAQ